VSRGARRRSGQRKRPIPATGRRVSRHPNRHRGADISTSGHRRQVVDLSDYLLRLEPLKDAKAECGRPDAAARTRQAGQVEVRGRPQCGSVIRNSFAAASVVSRSNFIEFSAEHIAELVAGRVVISGVAHTTPPRYFRFARRPSKSIVSHQIVTRALYGCREPRNKLSISDCTILGFGYYLRRGHQLARGPPVQARLRLKC
jgi:hypothetical protein